RARPPPGWSCASSAWPRARDQPAQELVDGGDELGHAPDVVGAQPGVVGVTGEAEARGKLGAARIGLVAPELEARVDRVAILEADRVARLVLGEQHLVDLLSWPDTDDLA